MAIGTAVLAMCASVVFWATTFVPVKSYHAGDGMFYQLTMALGIFLVGLFVQLVRDSPPFDPIAMIGGIMWATGNVCCVSIVETVGIGMGMLLWGLVNTFAGWACGFFGILGVATQSVSTPSLNIAGVLVIVAGAAIMSFLDPNSSSASSSASLSSTASDTSLCKACVDASSTIIELADARPFSLKIDPDAGSKDAAATSTSAVATTAASDKVKVMDMPVCTCASSPSQALKSRSPSLRATTAAASPFRPVVMLPATPIMRKTASKRSSSSSSSSSSPPQSTAQSHSTATTTTASLHSDEVVPEWVRKLSTTQRKLVGAALAIFAGLLFGTNFNPVQHQIDKGAPAHSEHALDYVFSHFVGIFFAALLYFALYCGMRRNQPDINPQIALPGIVSGVMWGIAEACVFVAMDQLQQVVVTPICSIMPGVLASVIAVVIYDEMPGRRNMFVLCSSIAVASVGVIMIALSKAM